MSVFALLSYQNAQLWHARQAFPTLNLLPEGMHVY